VRRHPRLHRQCRAAVAGRFHRPLDGDVHQAGEVVEQRDRETMQEFTVRIEKAAVFRSLENLMTFPFVRSLVERGEINLHGAYFGVAEGSLFVLDPAAKEFHSVRETA